MDIADDLDLLHVFDEVQALIAPYAAADTRRPYTEEAIEAEQAYVRTMIETRRAVLGEQGFD